MTPLHDIGNAIRATLLLIPMPVVRGLFLLLILSVLVWVMRLPKSETSMPLADGKTGFDLRWGAAVALVLQLLIYSIF